MFRSFLEPDFFKLRRSPFSKWRLHSSNLFDDSEFYLSLILSLYEAKYLAQIFCFIKGQYLTQMKLQIVSQIIYVDPALLIEIGCLFIGIFSHGCCCLVHAFVVLVVVV